MATFGTKQPHSISSDTGEHILHTAIRMLALALAAIAVLYAIQAYGKFDTLSDNTSPLTRYDIPSSP